VLAVGDAEFPQKCLGRWKTWQKREGEQEKLNAIIESITKGGVRCLK